MDLIMQCNIQEWGYWIMPCWVIWIVQANLILWPWTVQCNITSGATQLWPTEYYLLHKLTSFVIMNYAVQHYEWDYSIMPYWVLFVAQANLILWP